MMTSWIMPQALGYFWQGSGSWAYLLPTAGLHWAGPHLGALSESPVAPDEVKNALRPVLMAVSSSRLIKMPIYHFQPGLIGFRVPAFRARLASQIECVLSSGARARVFASRRVIERLISRVRGSSAPQGRGRGYELGQNMHGTFHTQLMLIKALLGEKIVHLALCAEVLGPD